MSVLRLRRAASDGNFYGTTQYGGGYDAGTLFKMTPAGALASLVQFAPFPLLRGSYPQAGLIRGADNNLYGTTYAGGKGGAGTVFRLRFGPTPVTLAATAVARTSAALQGTVNPHGFSTSVWFGYGVSSTLAGATIVYLGTIPAGTTPQALSLQVSGLTPNTDYYFRIMAQNSQNALQQRGSTRKFRTLP